MQITGCFWCVAVHIGSAQYLTITSHDCSAISLGAGRVAGPHPDQLPARASDATAPSVAKLGIEQDDEAPDRAFTHLLALCRAHRLTSYDAIYLDLAIRRSLPLATRDDDLRKTAKKLDVGLLG